MNVRALPRRRRAPVVAVEVRVPSLGASFGALARMEPEGVVVSTFNELAVGTFVVVELALPDGPAVEGGYVLARSARAEPGVAIGFDELEGTSRVRLSMACGELAREVA